MQQLHWETMAQLMYWVGTTLTVKLHIWLAHFHHLFSQQLSHYIVLNKSLLPLIILRSRSFYDNSKNTGQIIFFFCKRKANILWLLGKHPKTAHQKAGKWQRSRFSMMFTSSKQDPESPRWVHPNSCITSQVWLGFTKPLLCPVLFVLQVPPKHSVVTV